MTTTYIAQSARGRPVMTFDSEESARAFVAQRASQRLQLVRVTETRERLQ